MSNHNFIQFSKPFIDALTETLEMMVQTKIKAHSPQMKTTQTARGDISAIIGMNGIVERDGETKNVKGLMVLSWPEEMYVALAGRMLFEEYQEYCDDIADTGAEISNIVMGNAKNHLNGMGYKIEMATPSTIRGKAHEISYPAKTDVVEIMINCDLGDFSLELCYQEHS